MQIVSFEKYHIAQTPRFFLEQENDLVQQLPVPFQPYLSIPRTGLTQVIGQVCLIEGPSEFPFEGFVD